MLTYAYASLGLINFSAIYPDQSYRLVRIRLVPTEICTLQFALGLYLKILGRSIGLVLPFYRAMHFSAKRGIAIAWRLSVCPSVCL